MTSEMYGILGTLLGVLIGAPVTYYFAKKMFIHQREMEASAKFRKVFVDPLILCSSKPSDENFSIVGWFQENEGTLLKAITLYSPYVSSKKLHAFNQACDELMSFAGSSPIKFADISGPSQEVDLVGLSESQIKGKVKQRIERLVAFAPNK